jgi:hypothetical protein
MLRYAARFHGKFQNKIQNKKFQNKKFQNKKFQNKKIQNKIFGGLGPLVWP